MSAVLTVRTVVQGHIKGCNPTPKAHPQMIPLSELERRDALIRIGTELGRQRMEALGAGADLLASLIATAIVEADVQLTKREV